MKKILLVIICNLILLITGFAQWQKVNNVSADGYILYALTVDPTTNNIFAGTEHGVFVSTDDGSTWVSKNEDFLVNDFNVSSIAISGSNIFIGTWWEFGAFLSTNNGSSWTPVNNGMSDDDLGVSTIAISENKILRAYGANVYLSTNSGTNWTALNVEDLLIELKKGGWGYYANVRTIAISGNNIFIGTVHGVYLSINDGKSWTPLNNGLSKKGLKVNTIAVGVNIFVGTQDGVFLSTNINSWTPVNNGLSGKGLNVNTLAISGNNIFAGTHDGVFLSTNNGNSWTPVNNGLSGKDLNVNTIAISGDNIYIGIVHVGLKAYSSIWKRLQSELIISIN